MASSKAELLREAKGLNLPCANSCTHFTGFDREFGFPLVRCGLAPRLLDTNDQLVTVKKARGCPGTTVTVRVRTAHLNPPPDS